MKHANTHRTARRRQRGIAIMVTAVMLLVLIPIVGLALDAVVLYALKAKLSTAADAASIAAARSLNVGITLAEQEESARQRAVDFFRANFPNNAWNTANHNVFATVAETAFRTRTVTVSAAIDAPQYFMRWLGFTSTRISASGRASRRDVNLVMVLDRSGSMGTAATAGSPCAVMKTAASTFTNMFAEGRDRLGFVAYGTGYHVGFQPSLNFKTGGSSSMPGRLASMNCLGATSTAMAISVAYDLLKDIDEPGALNLIVLFTDGWPNSITAELPYRRVSDSRYGGVRRDTSTTRQINTRYPAAYSSNSTTYNNMPPSPCRVGNTSSPPYHYYNMRCNNAACSNSTNYSAPNWNPNWHPPNRVGVVTQAAGDQDDTSYGSTVGPLLHEDPSLTHSGTVMLPGLSDCAATTDITNTNTYGSMRRDIAYLPDQDIYGNSTRGYMPFIGNMQFGAGHPHAGRIRVDVPRAMTRAGMNAADSAAQRVRDDYILNPVIYVIGLGAVNHEINRRMANDPTSPIFDPNRPEGLYVYAATTTQLNYAFVRVASEILRLAQ